MIVILDDESRRLAAMKVALSKRLPDYRVATFANAADTIEWLQDNLAEVTLISLDHDLLPSGPDAPDPGSGRDVADFLASRSPVCHVIIHTTNSMAAPSMQMVLDDAGWPNSRVCPYGDLDWVTEWWIREVADHVS